MDWRMMYTYNAQVLEITDGDTIILEIDVGFKLKTIQKVRLLGVDTPELRSKNLEERNLALIAKQTLIDMILNKKVLIKTHKTDSFGRYLGDVFYNDINISTYLIEKGYGKKYE